MKVAYCQNCADSEKELSALRSRVEEAERERDLWIEKYGHAMNGLSAETARATAAEGRLERAVELLRECRKPVSERGWSEVVAKIDALLSEGNEKVTTEHPGERGGEGRYPTDSTNSPIDYKTKASPRDAALEEAARIALEGEGVFVDYAPDPAYNTPANARTWATMRDIATRIRALKKGGA